MRERDLLAQFRPRLCPNCGYDLRGLPSLHRCPECGFDIEDALLVQPPSNRPLFLLGIMGALVGTMLLIVYLLDRDWFGVFAVSSLVFVCGISFWWARPRNGLARDQTALLFTRSGVVEYRRRRKRQMSWSDISVPSLDVSAPLASKTEDSPVHMWYITIIANTDVPRMAGSLDALVKGIPDDGRIWAHFHATISQGNALRDEIIRRHTKANCDAPLTPDA